MAALIAALLDITVLSIYARPISTSWLLYLVVATLPMALSMYTMPKIPACTFASMFQLCQHEWRNAERNTQVHHQER